MSDLFKSTFVYGLKKANLPDSKFWNGIEMKE